VTTTNRGSSVERAAADERWGDVTSVRHEYPSGYGPLAFCRSCGADFSGDALFDRHRTGLHEFTLYEGLKREPPCEDGRRCLSADEMIALGWRTLANEELLASRRDRHRAGFGIPLWIDPAGRERVQDGFGASPRSAEGVDGEAQRGVDATHGPRFGSGAREAAATINGQETLPGLGIDAGDVTAPRNPEADDGARRGRRP
jgi:hypothetical protein